MKKMIRTASEPGIGSGYQSKREAERRKILFLTYRFPYPLIGGDRIKSNHLLRHLGTTADVDLISLDEWGTANTEALEAIAPFVRSLTVVPFSKAGSVARIVGSLVSGTPMEMAYYY